MAITALYDVIALILLGIAAPVAAVFLTSTTNAMTSPRLADGKFEPAHFLNGPDLSILSFLQYFVILFFHPTLFPGFKAGLAIPVASFVCLIISVYDKQRKAERWHAIENGTRRRHAWANNLVGGAPLVAITVMISILSFTT